MVWSPSDLDLNSIFYAYLSDVAKSMDTLKGFPGSSNHKESTCSRGYLGSLSWEDLLEKEMVTHSNILAWRIP